MVSFDRRNVKNLYALSPLQEGMLYHALREPQSRAYVEQIAFRIDGPLDGAAYLEAWQMVAARHDILRTVFATRNVPQPVQVVLRTARLPVVHEDLRGRTGLEARQRIDGYKADDIRRGFDLTAEVPVRLALFRTDDDEHRVVWTFHHILLDGWSLGVLQRDLDACYRAIVRGEGDPLPPAPPYGAYIRWLAGRDRGAALAFWQRELDGVTRPTPMPRRLAARFKPEASTYDGGEVRHALSASAQAKLEALARNNAVTANVVVQTLWGVLLGGLNGRDDAVFAATVAGRPPGLAHVDEIAGLFINAVPVRVRFDDGVSFGGLLKRVHEHGIAARDFHHAPLADVQAAHPLRQELIDHILVFENYPIGAKAAGPGEGLRIAEDDIDLHEYTHYPFEVQFLPGVPSVLRLRFNRHLFDDGAMAAIGQRFEDMLLAADTELPARDVAFAHRGWPAPGTLALAASFTAEPIVDAAAAWLQHLACPTRVDLAPYNQCLQQLANPDSALNRAEIGVLMLRLVDARRDLPADEGAARAALEARLAALEQQMANRQSWPARNSLVVAFLPSPPAAESVDAHAAALEQRWRAFVARLPGVSAIDLTDIAARHNVPEVFDAEADRLGHLPFTDAACAALGAEVARVAMARARPPFKVIAVDCDNTLWAGLCGEAGPLGVEIGPGHAALQRFLLARQADGFLLALVSKNIPEDVWRVFERNPRMVLKREHITTSVINWQPKSGNLRSLAAQLNLGVDSVIFIDDSPAECAEVMQNCPEVLAIPLPAAEPDLYGEWLDGWWAFDNPTVTTEDRQRAAMMRAELARQALVEPASAEGGSDGAPLAALVAQMGLRVQVGPVQPHQVARVAQLTQRTNQFNLSGRRYDEAQIGALAAAPDTKVLAVEVEDRFGAYGLTGVVIVRNEPPALALDTYLLSCRVLGRSVESTILSALAGLARRDALREIVAPLVPTVRNQPIRDFLGAPPWHAAGRERFVAEVDKIGAVAAGITALTDVVFAPPRPAETATPVVAAPSSAPITKRRQPAWTMPILNEAKLRHSVQYLPVLACGIAGPTDRKSARSVRAGGRPARPGLEQQIAAIWKEILGLAEIDVERGFLEQGGHSLHAVRIVSRLERALGREIGLTRFLGCDTVAALARWLDAQDPNPALPPAAIPPAAPAPHYPLSASQERMWLLAKLDDGDGGAGLAYNLCAAFRVTGPLDVARFARAVRRLVGRHTALRTVFPLLADGPRQRLLATGDVEVEREDDPGAPLERIAATIAGRARAAFDLEKGPLFRVGLHRRGGDDHVVAIYLHHIVADGWSFGRLMSDLVRFYGDAEPADAGGLRYVDYAAWTRSPEFERSLPAHAAYWRQRLGSLPPIATVPTDRPRPATRSGRGAAISRTLYADRRDLDRWAAQRGVGPFALLATLVAVLLHRLSGESGRQAVRLGTPVSGRVRPELEDIVGMFVNTLVLDLETTDDDRFEALLATMRERIAGALEHQVYPFHRLVADLQPPREIGRNPVFDVLVALQDLPPSESAPEGLTVAEFPIDSGLAAFDLVFEFGTGQAGELRCDLRYSTDLYQAATAVRLLDRLSALLASALTAPEALVADLQLLDNEEAAALASFAEGPVRPVPETTIDALFAAQVARAPQAPALIAAADGELKLDFRTLDGRANHLAQMLKEKFGIGPGDVVAVLLERTPAWPVALLAILKAGAVYLPLDPRHPPRRLDEVLADAGPRALLSTPTLTANLTRPPPCLDPGKAVGVTAESPRPAAAPDDPAYLIYTSGSTGAPKGVLVPHRAFVNMILDQIRGFAIGDDDTVLQIASCAFDASLSEMFMGWLAGRPVALADSETIADAARLASFIRSSGATIATFTPSYFRQLADPDIAALRRIILAGEAVLASDAARLHRLGLIGYNAYGPTETAVCATLQRMDPDSPIIGIGRPLANLAIRIVDDRGRPAPIGVAGEIMILGMGVALGYRHRPELTGERFFATPDGRRGYRTGDLGRWLPDGSIEFLGRRDEQVKIRGQRLELGEVTARLAGLQGVRQAAVVAEPGPTGTELVAYVAAAADREPGLRAEMATILPAHMIPARFVVVDALPMTTSGKLDRRALPKAGAPPASAAASPTSVLERAILDIWRARLPSLAGVETDFFAAGGNSLLAMSLARDISHKLGVACPAVLLFRRPTVRALARALEAKRTGPCELLHRYGDGEGRPLIALPPAPGLGLVYAPLAAQLAGWAVHAFDFEDRPLPDLVVLYLEQIAALRLSQAPVLLGHSGGGKLALLLAAELAAAQTPPARVVLLDCWHWSAGADALERAQNPSAWESFAPLMDDAERERVLALDNAYRRRLRACTPTEILSIEIDHLVAASTGEAMPNGFTRDWRHLTRTSYTEVTLPYGHHEMLGPPHVARTARILADILSGEREPVAPRRPAGPMRESVQ